MLILYFVVFEKVTNQIKHIHSHTKVLLSTTCTITFITINFITLKYKGGTSCKNENTQYGHSLNKDRRKRELQRITKQNHKILKRIQEARPTYNHHLWEDKAKFNDRILANICEFRQKGTCMGGGGEGVRDKGFFNEDFLLDYDCY